MGRRNVRIRECCSPYRLQIAIFAREPTESAEPRDHTSTRRPSCGDVLPVGWSFCPYSDLPRRVAPIDGCNREIRQGWPKQSISVHNGRRCASDYYARDRGDELSHKRFCTGVHRPLRHRTCESFSLSKINRIIIFAKLIVTQRRWHITLVSGKIDVFEQTNQPNLAGNSSISSDQNRGQHRPADSFHGCLLSRFMGRSLGKVQNLSVYEVWRISALVL